MKHYDEDRQVGDEFTTPARTIAESDVLMFAGLSGTDIQLRTGCGDITHMVDILSQRHEAVHEGAMTTMIGRRPMQANP